jgi:cytochrome c-type biogenesis protein CcmH/NrfF
LRAEIRRRLQGGESAAVIEDDIVSRYGEKIRAVPKGKSLTAMGVWLSIVIAIAGLGAIGLVVRWVRRGRAKLRRDESAPTAQAAASDAYDERLDAELRELDN